MLSSHWLLDGNEAIRCRYSLEFELRRRNRGRAIASVAHTLVSLNLASVSLTTRFGQQVVVQLPVLLAQSGASQRGLIASIEAIAPAPSGGIVTQLLDDNERVLRRVTDPSIAFFSLRLRGFRRG